MQALISKIRAIIVAERANVEALRQSTARACADGSIFA